MGSPVSFTTPSSALKQLCWAAIVAIALCEVSSSGPIDAAGETSSAAGFSSSSQGAAPSAGSSSFAQANPRLRALPPVAEDGITFAQFTDNRPLDLSRAGGRIGFVWGGSARSSLAIGSRYYPLDRDFDRSHTAQWYAQTAPDWIVYKCDRKTPAALFTYSWGSYAPVDITNPAVRRYIFDTYIQPALASGQKVIAVDNASLRNGGRRCGVFRHGQWVQLFSGQGKDPAYVAAVLDWVGWLAKEIHAQGGLLALNAKVDPDNVEATRKLVQLSDIWLDEAAFSRDCNARVGDRNWQVKMELSQWAAARMPWISLEKTCASPSALSDDEAQWVVGNFLLAKGPQSYFGAVHDGDRRGALRYPRTLNPAVGKAQGLAFPIPGGGMARRFSRGLVVVNPSSAASLHYVLPAGNWTNIGGTPVAGTATLGPTSAAIFLSH